VTAPDRDFRSSVRNISYDYRNGRGVVLLDEGSGFELDQVVALFANVDPQIKQIKIIAGRRTCATCSLIAGHWVTFR
jgi:hypothetical protein